jgi:hypothetical protein
MSTSRLACLLSVALLSFAPACSCSTPSDTDDAGRDAPTIDSADHDSGGLDSGGVDSGGEIDGGESVDAAMNDVGLSDAPRPDAPLPDGGMCTDLPADPTRPVAIQCSPCRPPGPVVVGGGGGGGCASDADCTEGDNGRCRFGRIGPFCDYDTCFVDGDCENDELCLCDGSDSGTGGGNVCISAECRIDADCAGGFACSPTLGSCGHYTNFVAYRCHRADDECGSDADCDGLGYCAFDAAANHWACSSSECAG